MSHCLGFDFYGAGNIGDDLTLAGFFDAFEGTQPFAAVAFDPASQRRRFPRAHWLPRTDRSKDALMDAASSWIGVGGTPFQVTSGMWSLNEMNDRLAVARSRNIPIAMLGVGTEKEALSARQSIENFLGKIDMIWTRDAMSSEVLIGLGAERARIITAADLAHIALSRMPQPGGERPYAIGIGYFSESAPDTDIVALAGFIKAARMSRALCYISNEFRPQHEYQTYAQVLRVIGELKPRFRRWRRPGVTYATNVCGTVPLFVPEYLGGTLAEFVAPYGKCDTILSSRYHGVLAAAWLGCRVGIFGGRSSKVDALAAQFGIPMVKSPYSPETIEELAQAAVPVERNLLRKEADRAVDAVHGFERWLAAA